MSSYLVSDGRNLTVSLLVAASGRPHYIGFGTGSGNTSPSDQALFTEISGSRINGTVSQVTTTTSGDTYQVVGTFTATSSGTLTNIGIFNSGASPVQSQLTSQISSNSQSSIQINGYGSWPNSFPFNIQVSTEVMTVVSGNGSSVFYVTRGANGSTALTSAAIGTTVTQVTGTLFAKTNFGGFPLTAGDVLQFTIGIQYQ